MRGVDAKTKTFRQAALRAWAAFCTVAIVVLGAWLWWAFVTLPTDHRYTGPVCVCPADDGKPPSARATEERYY